MGTHVWNLERQSFRDDLEAVGLTLAYLLLCVTLPWIDDVYVAAEMQRQIQAKTMPTRLADLCGTPVLEEYLKDVQSLGVDEQPNYERLVTMLSNEANECFS